MSEFETSIIFLCICVFITVTSLCLVMEFMNWFFKRNSKKEVVKHNRELKKKIKDLEWLLKDTVK
jgi:hypothetical protein